MPKESEHSEPSATADRACAACREKKIRCGRERPKCTNCRRQRWKCDYSAPEKRVSHIKLLCENVNSLDTRLGNIESEILRLTKMHDRNRTSSISSTDIRTGSISISGSSRNSPDRGDEEVVDRNRMLLPHREIVHLLTADRYYGPDTMYAWSQAFRIFIASHTGESARKDSGFNTPTPTEHRSKIVDQCLAELQELSALTTDLEGFSVEEGPILLPPRQFLPMFHTRLFHHNDWSMDLFVQSKFWEQVERVYSNYDPDQDEPWAIIFNTMILLSLSMEGSLHGPGSPDISQFATPFFSSLHLAMRKLHTLVAPRLVNVQALAVLSLAAELFYPFGIAEKVFVQACNLTRSMGLNQVDMHNCDESPNEALERLKVFQSLYNRDKSLGISRGIICWLPGFEIQRLNLGDTNTAEGKYNAARVTISAFQERVYRLHSASHSQDEYAHMAGFHPAGVQNGFEELLGIGSIFGPHLELWLEFLATRIVALRRSTKLRYVTRTLQDCRACCILLLISFGEADDAMKARLDMLIDMQGQSEQQAVAPALESEAIAKQHASFMPQRLLNIFPVSALFLLAANLINPMLPDEQPAQDLELLLKVSGCYQDARTRLQTINRGQQVGSALERILSIVEHVRGLHATNDPVGDAQHADLSRTVSTSSPQDHSLGVTKSIPDFMSLQQLPIDYVMSNGAAFNAPMTSPPTVGPFFTMDSNLMPLPELSDFEGSHGYQPDKFWNPQPLT